MESDPRLQSIDQVPAGAVAVEQPLVLLVENGPAFSALLATHVSSEPDDGCIILEDCTQVRIERNGDCVRRRFARVRVLREPTRNHWVATPDEFLSVFSQPSVDPYVFVQLTRAHAGRLEQAIRQEDFETVFDELRDRFARLPRFYSGTPTELRAPDRYANGRDAFPEVDRFL